MNELMNELYLLMKEKNIIEAREKELKQQIENEMLEKNQDKCESENLKIARVGETTTTTFDTTLFKKKEPQLYMELLEDYQKTTTRKGYLKVSVK